MASIDGDWDVTIKSPMGDQKAVLTVKSDGGTFAGKMSGGLGTMDIANGTVDGNTLSWGMDITVPMPTRVPSPTATEAARRTPGARWPGRSDGVRDLAVAQDPSS